MKNLGQQIRMFREQKGTTLNAYAQKLGVSPGYLSNLETGKTDTIQLSLLEQLTKELNLNLALQDNISTNDELSIRIQRTHSLLQKLDSTNPEASEYLLHTMEQGIELFMSKSRQ